MAKHGTITDPELRALLAEAHGLLRSGDPSAAVHVLADVFIRMVVEHPELRSKTAAVRGGRAMPVLARWPALGANLDLASLGQDKPRIEFVRDRFAMSEALTYYEFTVDLARDEHF